MAHAVWSNEAIMQLTLIGDCIGSQIVNVFHFEAPGAVDSGLTDDTLAQGWCDARTDFWITTSKTAWLACHNSEYTLTMVKGQVLERKGFFERKLTSTERPLTSANVGAFANPVENAGVCVVMRWRTPVAGKASRGRSYIGPVPAQYQNNGLLDSAFRTAYTAFGTHMTTTYSGAAGNTNGMLMTVYSRPYNTGEYQYASRKTGTLTVVTPPDYAGNSTNVTTASLDPTLRGQRRRHLGVGA